MKKYFSAEKWENDNAELKKECNWLYELSRMTFVQDADGAEIIDGEMIGKSGAVYHVMNDEGVVEVAEPEAPAPVEPAKPVPYEIIIHCDGKTTQAVMNINGKTVRESCARRNPEDKFDFKVGAEYAFNRLFEKEKKGRKVYNVGDVVRIRKDLKVNIHKDESEYGGCFVTREMKKYFGKVAKIVERDDRFENRYLVEVDGKGVFWYWSTEMFEEHAGFEVGDRVIVEGCVKPHSLYLNGKHGKIVHIERNVFDPDYFPFPCDVANVRLDDGCCRRIFVRRLKHE